MIVAEWMLLSLAILVSLPVAVLLLQVICAALPAAREGEGRASKRPRLAVVVPAHDEAAGIAGTLGSIRGQLAAEDRLVVVADNCTDDTAGVARAAGAEVVERRDSARRGKGYALDFGVRHLRAVPPEVLIIVDADCQLADATIDRIARFSGATGRPVQALYLMKTPPSSQQVAIAEFAQRIKNQVRPLGWQRLGLPCQLMGTGMALPWPLAQSLSLATGHLVEDMKMGIDCAEAGMAPLFCPAAQVTSYFPANLPGARSQRTRWEHGHLAMIAAAPRLMLRGLRHGNIGVFALAVDLCIPPLALLSLMVLATCALSLALYAAGGDALPLQVALVVLAALIGAVLLAWARFGRDLISLRDMARVPLYVMAKVPMYLRFLTRRQMEWVRSRRDEN